MHTKPSPLRDKIWRRWFAWYPIVTTNGRFVWLEVVEYRWDGSGYDPGTEYKILLDISS